MQRWLWVGLVTAAAAQAAPAQPAADPGKPAQTAPPLLSVAPYRSAFADFRPFDEQPSQDWRRVNDEMQRLGGHAGHLRAAAPSSTPAATGSTAQPGVKKAQGAGR